MPTARSEEIRARRTLKRRGFALNKSRSRDPQALAYGTYWIFDPDDKALIFPTGDNASNFGATLEEIIEWIDTPLGEKKPSRGKRKAGKA